MTDGVSILFSEEAISERVDALGREISLDYADRPPVLISALKGGVVFLADLHRRIELPVRVDFMSISHYTEGAQASGVVRILKDLEANIEGRHVIVVEDIVDSGLTLSYLLRNLRARRTASVEVCALLTKPARRKADIVCRYVGFEIPNRFAIGYGLDYGERYRGLPYVAALDETKLPDEFE